jgi:hypothetical protein
LAFEPLSLNGLPDRDEICEFFGVQNLEHFGFGPSASGCNNSGCFRGVGRVGTQLITRLQNFLIVEH